MASSKNNGLNVANNDHEDEILIEPIQIDPESLKRAVEEKKRLQSQDSVAKEAEDQKKKANNFNKNRRQSSSNGTANKQFNRQASNNTDKAANGGSEHAKSANARRTSYNNNRSKSSKQSFDDKSGRVNNKTRSTSTKDESALSGDEKKRNRSSTASNGKFRNKSYSVNSNGESFDYDDYELEEPFSDSDDESPRVQQKPSLIIPRGRIRTLSGTIPPTGFSPKFGGPTMCLSCLQFFELPDLLEKFSSHLLTEHQIVIEEVELIVDPKRYVEHWRQRFSKQSIADVFPKIVPKEGDELFGKVDYYFKMSEHIPEDYSLRQRLAMRRLEEALGCQQREREESNFSLPCIFCRYVARGNRSKIIHHLYMIHHLNLGSPDNLVFVQEYIEHLREKINRNECIYCEKTFADRMTLMDHMRKRNHREVNPTNNYYDKFYIINYLELGKRWLEVLAEDFEDTMPTFADSDDEEEEETWNEWNEDNTDEDQLRVVCLFCNNNQESVPALLSHMNDSHQFDFVKFIKDEKLGTYERAKFINFLRKRNFNTPKKEAGDENSPKPANLPKKEEWNVEDELVPMFGNDHFLWLLESYLDEIDGGALKELEVDDDQNLPFKHDESSEEKAKRVVESKTNTVDGVVAEDVPDLSESYLAKDDFYKTLC